MKDRYIAGTLSCRLFGHKFLIVRSWYEGLIKIVEKYPSDYCARCGILKNDIKPDAK